MADEVKIQLSPDQLKEKDECVKRAKWLAHQMNTQIGILSMFQQIQPFDVIIALGILLAGLMTGTDGQVTVWEEQGNGLVDDDTRIAHFNEMLRDFMKQMRDDIADKHMDEQATGVDKATRKATNKGVH